MDVSNYVEVSRALVDKFDNLKRGKNLKYQLMSERYAPITAPLQSLNSNIGNFGRKPPSEQKFFKTEANLKKEEEEPDDELEGDEYWYADDDIETVIGVDDEADFTPILQSPRESRKYLKDSKYGLRVVRGEYKIGNKPVRITGTNKLILDKQKQYQLTPGLVNLLTLDNLSTRDFTDEDYTNYGEIVKGTHCYKYRNNPDSKKLKGYRTKKFTSIIAPLLTDPSPKQGTGLRKLLTNNPVEYVYWNNLGELLERLYILYGEIKAGNNNPNLINEIVNIIQEFREL